MIIFFSVIIDQLVCKSKADPLQLIRPHHLEDSLSTAQRFPPPEKKKPLLQGTNEVRKDGRSGPDVEELGASDRKEAKGR